MSLVINALGGRHTDRQTCKPKQLEVTRYLCHATVGPKP